MVVEGKVELVADLFVRRAGERDAAGLGQRLQAGGDVDAVAVDVVAVDDDVAQVDAYAEVHPFVIGQARVALGHHPLHLDGTGDRVDDAREFQQQAVAGGLDDAAAVGLDDGVGGGAVVLEARQRAGLVEPHQPAVAGDVGGDDRREPACHLVFGHVPAPTLERGQYSPRLIFIPRP